MSSLAVRQEASHEALFAEAFSAETAIAHGIHAGPDAAADALAQSGERGIVQKIADKMAESSIGTRVLGGVAAALAVGATLPASARGVEGGDSVTTIVDTETGVTIRAGKSWQRDKDASSVTIMGNHRVVSKAEVKEAKRDGDCFWVNGKKQEQYTEGVTANGVGMGRDYRKNLICEVDKDVNGDGKVNDDDIVRAKCGNLVELEQPETFFDHVVWVEGKGFINVRAQSKATAKAFCSTSDGLAGAEAYGYGAASAAGKLRMKGGTRTIVKRAQRMVDTKVEQSLAGKGGAKSNAFAAAEAQCTEGNDTKPNIPNSSKPSVDVIGPQHVLANGVVDICAYGIGNIVSRSFSETGNGNFISPVYSGDEAGEFCQTYKAGTESDTATVTATVTDSANQSASDSESFPIVGNEDPRGQF